MPGSGPASLARAPAVAALGNSETNLGVCLWHKGVGRWREGPCGRISSHLTFPLLCFGRGLDPCGSCPPHLGSGASTCSCPCPSVKWGSDLPSAWVQGSWGDAWFAVSRAPCGTVFFLLPLVPSHLPSSLRCFQQSRKCSLCPGHQAGLRETEPGRSTQPSTLNQDHPW